MIGNVVTPQDYPPFVRFESKSQERRDANGNAFFVAVDFVIITPVGTKDEHEKPVEDWFKYLAQLERMDRWPKKWTISYREAYEAWKKGEELPREGTPIANWPVATKAQVEILKAVRVYTVEDMAAANEETMTRIGMGGRSLKQMAQNWLVAQNDTAPLIARIEALEQANRQLQASLADKSEALARVAGAPHEMPPAPVGSLESRLAIARGSDAEDEVDRILG